MSLEFYKLLHIFGLLFVFGGLVALWGAKASGTPPTKRFYSRLAMIHGLGLLFMLVSGFGMLARLGLLSSLPGWAYAKLLIWLLLGGAMALVKRKASAIPQLLGLIGLVTLAAYFALFKPF